MRGIAPLCFGLLVAGGILGCDSGSGDRAEPRPRLAGKGGELYTAHCARCHGQNGEGRVRGNATALNNQDFLATASDQFLWGAITYGRPGTEMPVWGREAGGPLAKEEISDLVALLRSWQKESTRKLRSGKIRGSPERGRALYALNCANCHGEDGIGNLGMGPGLNNQAFLRAASDGFLWEAIAKGRRETPMFPSLQGLGGVRQLSSEEINDLVAFIRSWEKP